MFATGLGPVAVSAFGLSTMLIAVPTGREDLQLDGDGVGRVSTAQTPMLFALGFIAMFTIGGLSGVMHSIVPADTQQTDTYFVVAHFHYVLFGGLVFAIFGGIYYWFPKLYGRYMNERLGKINFWTMFVGFNLTFFPMHLLGLMGHAASHLLLLQGYGWDSMNHALDDRVVHHRVLGAALHRQHAREPAPRRARARLTRGTGARSSGRFRRHRRSTTSPRSRSSKRRDDFWHRKYTEDENGQLVRLPRGGADRHRGRSATGPTVATSTTSTCRRRRTTRS